jgi:LacI family transcriptional regulator/LacI family purine nucleotide synthesis repressor
MPSLKDIAVVCNVSIATVSKALNDHRDIGASTKARIRETAKEMGYLPNAQARALKTNRTHNIGVLFTDDSGCGLKQDYFSNILDTFKKTVEEQGYDITFINSSQKGRNGLTILEHCKYRGFDGVLILCVDFHDSQVLELVESDIPIVTIDYMFHNKTSIISNNVQGMRDLVTHIYSKGHRKIAYIHGENTSVTQNRLASFYKTADELGLSIPDEYVREATYRNTRKSYERTLELLALPDPPTCIIYPDDFSCFGGINAIKEQGLVIPDDISVVGYDGIRSSRHIEPQLTTLWQDADALGGKAGTMMVALIEKPRTTLAEQIVIDGCLYEGKTVKELSRELPED